jgi:hypothetical protein
MCLIDNRCKKARTADNMFVINCLINKYCSSKDGRLLACFVDLKKAFDTVIHVGIKINKFWIHPKKNTMKYL